MADPSVADMVGSLSSFGAPPQQAPAPRAEEPAPTDFKLPELRALDANPVSRTTLPGQGTFDVGDLNRRAAESMARRRAEFEGEDVVGRRAIPFVSAYIRFHEANQAAEAGERIRAGNAQPGDYLHAARQEYFQRREAQRSTGEAVAAGLLHAPALLGETAAGGLLARGAGAALGLGAGEGAGLAARGATFAGRGAAVTALSPSAYLPQAAERAVEQGGRWSDAKNLGPAAALGYANTLVLGSLQTFGNAAPTFAGRVAAKAGIGMVEQAGVDVAGGLADEVLNDAWKTRTRYGLVGDIARRDLKGAARTAAVQSATFAAFAALHNRREGRDAALDVTRSWARAMDAGAARGESAAAAASRTAGVAAPFERLLVEQPDTAWERAREIYRDRSGAYTPAEKEYAEAITKAVEATKPEPVKPQEAPPAPAEARDPTVGSRPGEVAPETMAPAVPQPTAPETPRAKADRLEAERLSAAGSWRDAERAFDALNARKATGGRVDAGELAAAKKGRLAAKKRLAAATDAWHAAQSEAMKAEIGRATGVGPETARPAPPEPEPAPAAPEPASTPERPATATPEPQTGSAAKLAEAVGAGSTVRDLGNGMTQFDVGDRYVTVLEKGPGRVELQFDFGTAPEGVKNTGSVRGKAAALGGSIASFFPAMRKVLAAAKEQGLTVEYNASTAAARPRAPTAKGKAQVSRASFYEREMKAAGFEKVSETQNPTSVDAVWRPKEAKPLEAYVSPGENEPVPVRPFSEGRRPGEEGEPKLSEVERAAAEKEEGYAPPSAGVAELTPREERVLAAREQGKSLEAVGKELGLTRQRVQQIEASARQKQGGSRVGKAAEHVPAENVEGLTAAAKARVGYTDAEWGRLTDHEKQLEVETQKFLKEQADVAAELKRAGASDAAAASRVAAAVREGQAAGVREAQARAEAARPRGPAGAEPAPGAAGLSDKELARRAKREQVEGSLAKAVRDQGGIDPQSLELRKQIGGAKAATTEHGLPLSLFRKKGEALDVLAENLYRAGHTASPDPGQLLEALKEGAMSRHADLTHTHELRERERAKAMQEEEAERELDLARPWMTEGDKAREKQGDELMARQAEDIRREDAARREARRTPTEKEARRLAASLSRDELLRRAETLGLDRGRFLTWNKEQIARAVVLKARKGETQQLGVEGKPGEAAEPPAGAEAPEADLGGGVRFAGPPIQITLLDGLFKKGLGAGAAARRWLTSAGDLPPEVFAEKVAADGRIAADVQDVRNLEKDLRRATGPYDKVPPQVVRRMDAALKGDPAAMASLPPEVRVPLSAMRDKIDGMSHALIANGAVEGKLAAAIDANLGVYVTRQYRVFQDPRWAEKVPEDVRNRFKSWFRAEVEAAEGKAAATEERAEGVMRSLLYNDTAAESPIAFLAKSKLGSKDLGILQRRKALPDELRELWGEVKDPVANFAASVGRMSQLLHNHLFLSRVRRLGMGSFLSETPTPENYARIAAEGSEVMKPLNGVYTTPEIARAFKEAFDPPTRSALSRLYMGFLGMAKYAKTVLSPVTHLRNLMGNLGFAVANGHWRVGKAPAALKAVANDTAEGRAYYRRLLELGVVGEGVHEREFKQVVSDVFAAKETNAAEAVGMVSDRRIASWVKSGRNLAEKAYHAEDAVWKVYAFENEKARYSEAHPDWSPGRVEKTAAAIVRDTYPTYSMTPRAVKGLRKFPLAGPFVSFPAEVVRTTYKTLRLAVKELNDPLTRKIGATRLAGLALAATAPLAMGAASRAVLGLDADDEKAARRFLPEWSKDSPLLFVGRDDKGNLKYVDLGTTDPHSYLTEPVIAALRGRDPAQAVTNAVARAGDPFTQEELGTSALLDVARNRKQEGGWLGALSGRPERGTVYNPQAPAGEKALAVAGRLAEPLTPGGYSSFRRLGMAATGQAEQKTGRTYDLGDELTASATGQRVQAVDPRRGLAQRAKEFDAAKEDAAKLLTAAGRSKGTVSDQQLVEAYRQMERARKAAYDELRADALAAEKLGMTEVEVRKALRAGGVSPEDAADAVSGRYRPHPVTPEMFGGVPRAEAVRRAAVVRGAR